MAVKDLSRVVRSFENQPTVGTTDQNTEDILMPSTKGVYYIMFTRYPDAGVVNQDALKQIFRMLQKSVTIPDVTYNSVESINGFSGTSKSYTPSSIDVDNTITIGMNENVDRMVLNEFFNWSNSIMDMSTGLSRFEHFTARNISGDILIIHSKPVLITTPESLADNMLEAYFFKHITPSNIPLSAYGSVSKDESAKVEVEISFKFRSMITSINNESLREYAKAQLPALIEGVKMSGDVIFGD